MSVRKGHKGRRSMKTKLRFQAPPPFPKDKTRSHLKHGGSRLVGGSMTRSSRMHSVVHSVAYPIAPNRPIPPVTLAFSKPKA